MYAHRCESPNESANQVGRLSTHDISKWRTATTLGAWNKAWSGKSPRSALKIAKSACINQRRNWLAIFAADQNRRERHIKSPSVSPALWFPRCNAPCVIICKMAQYKSLITINQFGVVMMKKAWVLYSLHFKLRFEDSSQ